jgi:hypothetical protein
MDETSEGGGMTSLFDLDTVKMDSPRLKAIKAHDIQTHHAPHVKESPWLAIPMNEARRQLAIHKPTEQETAGVAEIMAGYCRVLEEAGLLFLGTTEREAQDAALAECYGNNN